MFAADVGRVLKHNRVVMNCRVKADPRLDYFNRIARGVV